MPASHTARDVRRLVPLALALLVVLSGCSALDPGGTDATPTATPPADTDVPGVTDGELTNASALVDAHVAALPETGFETNQDVNGTQVVRGEVRPSARRVRTLVESGAAEYRYRVLNREAGSRFDFWGNRTMQVVRSQYGGETRAVQVTNRTATVSALARATLLETYLGASAFSVAGQSTENGTTYVTLTADATTDPEAVSPTNATDVRNYDAEAVVDERGRVHSLTVTADYTHRGEAHSLSVVYQLTRLEVGDGDVTKPSWARERLQAGGS